MGMITAHVVVAPTSRLMEGSSQKESASERAGEACEVSAGSNEKARKEGSIKRREEDKSVRKRAEDDSRYRYDKPAIRSNPRSLNRPRACCLIERGVRHYPKEKIHLKIAHVKKTVDRPHRGHGGGDPACGRNEDPS